MNSKFRGYKYLLFYLALLKFAVVFIITLSSSYSSASVSVIIPDREIHSPFLYGDWNERRSNLAIFIDPLCPYCKKAIPKFDGLKDYNVYVFWAPIFGQRSEEIIQPLFNCTHPTDDKILHQLVSSRDTALDLDCGTYYRSELRRLNDDVVNSYSINAVPAFFIQGVRTSLARVYRAEQKPGKYVNGVALDWDRYELSKVVAKGRLTSQAMILPAILTEKIFQLIDQYRPSYLFSAGNWLEICEKVVVSACSNSDALAKNQQAYLELVALLDLQEQKSKVLIIANDGQVRSFD